MRAFDGTGRGSDKDIPFRITLLLAVSCGIIVANIYYAQPLVAQIGASIGLPPRASGLIVTLTQIGYGLGLLFIVPLGDLVENRRLVALSLLVAALALFAAAIARSPTLFLGAALVIGLGSVAAQVLVPFAAHLSPEATRGRVVGNVMSGLLFGIMLARPVSSMMTHLFGWHSIFALSSAVTAALAILLALALPSRRPLATTSYSSLVGSLWGLLKTTPILRRRAAYQACAYGAYSLFWTAVPQLLAGPAFHLSQKGIALFALVGAGGALVSPVAGRIADRGFTRPATGLALSVMLIALLLSCLARGPSPAALATLVLSAVLLDMGVSANLVLGQRSIYALDPAIRSRLNGLYLAIFFAGGAAGSAVGGWAYASGGGTMALGIAAVFPAAALLYFTTEKAGLYRHGSA